MSNSNATSKPIQREILPIPYQPYAGFVAYDAKGPVSKFAPIEELRPPKGHRTSRSFSSITSGLARRVRSGGRLRRHRRTARGQRIAVHAFSHCRAVLPTRAALLSLRTS